MGSNTGTTRDFSLVGRLDWNPSIIVVPTEENVGCELQALRLGKMTVPSGRFLSISITCIVYLNDVFDGG